jgi:NAD(P)-dependent dehydrogenase (short-subunit alcohol dehydrogenase family)
MSDAVVVTGVSKGLGAALAASLLARGYLVVGVGRSAARDLAGRSWRFVACDLGDVEGVEPAALSALHALAATSPDSVCLINNAATAEPVGVIGQLTARAIDRALAINLTAPTILANLFCRFFTDDALPRRIINISSGAAHSALPGVGPYSIAKAGLEMLTRSLVADAPAITTITLRPGIIDTPMQAFVRGHSPDVLPSVTMFRDFHATGQLVAPAIVAEKIVERLVRAPVEQGRTYTYREL